jgi:leader peptidase (prepilin peptidase) / N-methyltransferase
MSDVSVNSFIFFLGLIFGSFINVIVYRLPRGQSVICPPSHCPKCQHPIGWKDNIPILSYLLLRGKCRYCYTSISMRYPVIELLTALLFLATLNKRELSILLFLRDLPLIIILVSITFIDLEHRIIPDLLSFGGLGLGLLTSWATPEVGWISSLVGASLGFSIFFGLAWIYNRLFGKMGLGGGDIKLLAMLGAFFGPSGVLAVLLISSLTGSLVGISWALIKKEKQIMKVAIPYGPFLVLGALFHYLLGDLLWFPFMIQM